MGMTSTQSSARRRVSVAGVKVSPDHYINGARVAFSRTFHDVSPIDESLLADVSAGGPEEVALAVETAERAFSGWSSLGPTGRLPYLARFAGIIEGRVQDLAAVETTGNGSLLEASRSRVMRRGANNIRFCDVKTVCHRLGTFGGQVNREW